MRKTVTFLFIVFLLLLAAGAFAFRLQITSLFTQVSTTSGVITLYDEVLSLPGCSLAGVNSCDKLDQTGQSDVRKEIKIERFVVRSGYLAVYFVDKGGSNVGADGGFTTNQAYFAPNSGSRVEIADGLQFFERGNMMIEFDQPYKGDQRLATEYELVVYYVPHTDMEQQSLLLKYQTDPQEFYDYKQQNERNINVLCDALRSVSRVPSACPGSSTTSGAVSDTDDSFSSTSSAFVTDPKGINYP